LLVVEGRSHPVGHRARRVPEHIADQQLHPRGLQLVAFRAVILKYENSVLRTQPGGSVEDLAETFARRAIERSTAERQASYVEEIRLLVDATLRLIEKTGVFDPPLRDILK